MTNGATRGSADSPMPGKMTGNAANDGALDASLGISGGRKCEKRSRHHCACKTLRHRFVSPADNKVVIKHRGGLKVPGACTARNHGAAC
jgi:hypothetical protein